MRRWVALFLCPLIFCSLTLSGCGERMNADAALRNFLDAYPLARGTIFSSSAREGEGEYIDERTLVRLYGEGELPLYSSFAIYLYSDMDTVRECGIFVVRDGLGKTDDIVKTQDLFYERIHLVRLAFPEARARVMRFGNMVTYVILPDLERAQHLLRSLSHGG